MAKGSTAVASNTMSAGTSLAVVSKESFLALASAGGDIREAMESVGSVGEQFGPNDLTRVKIPSGGATMWAIPDGLGSEEYTPVIRGALVMVQKAGVLWQGFDPTPNSKPVLRSFDMNIAEITGPVPEFMQEAINAAKIDEKHVDLSKLSYNEFGSGKDGNGKRFKEQRVLFILRENDIYPLVVTVQPGSLTAWRQFFMNLPKKGIPYERAVIELSLLKATSNAGQSYAQIVPKLVGTLSREDGDMIQKTYRSVLDTVVRDVVERDVEDVTE